MKMNICIFARVLITHETGGMQQHTKDLSEELVKLGNKVIIITTAHPKNIRKEILNGVEIHYLNNVINSRYTRAWWKKSQKKFIELHKQIKFDIICSESTAGYSYIKYKLRKKFNLPFIVIVHGTPIGAIKSILNQKFSLRNFLNVLYYLYNYLTVSFVTLLYSDIAIAVSKELKRAIIHEFLINEKRIIYKPNGIDGNKFFPMSVKEKNKNKILLLIGRIIEGKGFQDLISILPSIINKINNVKLYILGSGPYLRHLKQSCHALNLINYVEFLGNIPNNELIYYYNLSDIFICPSTIKEGLPYVILEAMACGSTIIASKIGGIPTAIKNFSNGILVPPGDTNFLKKFILKLLKNEKLARKLAENARKDFLKEFDLKSIIFFHNNLFKNLCKKLK